MREKSDVVIKQAISFAILSRRVISMSHFPQCHVTPQSVVLLRHTHTYCSMQHHPLSNGVDKVEAQPRALDSSHFEITDED